MPNIANISQNLTSWLNTFVLWALFIISRGNLQSYIILHFSLFLPFAPGNEKPLLHAVLFMIKETHYSQKREFIKLHFEDSRQIELTLSNIKYPFSTSPSPIQQSLESVCNIFRQALESFLFFSPLFSTQHPQNCIFLLNFSLLKVLKAVKTEMTEQLPSSCPYIEVWEKSVPKPTSLHSLINTNQSCKQNKKII